MKKRNFKTKRYVPYSIPPDWNCPLCKKDYQMVANCTQCGVKKRFWDMYTSQTIHNESGFGYPVCEKCYDEESKLRILYQD
jgi:hypothetical protein